LGVLPAESTSFVGRRSELAEMKRLLGVARLVTLTGTGGVGKTRLATRAGTELRRVFHDGVRWVQLGELQDPELLPQTVAAALGIRDEAAEPVDRLAQFLVDKQLLLVMDNCEHLADQCAALIAELLSLSPGLSVIATSRQRLGVKGEHLLRVEPLPLPPPATERDWSAAPGFDSLSLFADRAAAVRPGFALAPENRETVANICRKVDGLPLGIELATVWLRVLSPSEILERLNDKLTLLSDPTSSSPLRQRGLEELIEWSYHLCSPEERLLWARLSVFSGSFDLAAVEAICSGDGLEGVSLLAALAGLVDNSVLNRVDETHVRPARYRMLKIIADFGAEQLAKAGQADDLLARHGDYYRALADQYERQQFSAAQLECLLQLQADHANVRRALEGWLAEPGSVAMDFAADLLTYWIAGGRLAEGRRWLDRSLAGESGSSVARARALGAWLTLSAWLGARDSVEERLDEYGELAQHLNHPRHLARHRVCVGIFTAYVLGSRDEGCRMLEQAVPLCRAAGDDGLTAEILSELATLKFILAQPDAHSLATEALDWCESHERPSWYTALALWVIGAISWQRGDIDRAEEMQRAAIELRRPMNDQSGIALSLDMLACCATSAKRFTAGAQLLGAAATVWRLSGAGRSVPALAEISTEPCADTLRGALGSEAFNRALAHGEALDLEQAIALALGESPRRATSHPTSKSPTMLTRRQSEIATLVAEGLSNKQIAKRLVISQRTVDTHIENVLVKMGFTSRGQIAAWVASGQGL
jgi:predicted ATPase/DNA-binding CsgD family transcriptional regulator